jgi:hypothetical protein
MWLELLRLRHGATGALQTMATPSLPVTMASLRPHGVRQLLVFCGGKREADWPVTIQASCRSSNSAQRKRCAILSAVADVRCGVGDVPI